MGYEALTITLQALRGDEMVDQFLNLSILKLINL